MDRNQAHKLVDQLFDMAENTPVDGDKASIEFGKAMDSAQDKPKDKRVVRTKSTGDRVYLIDENAKTKAWVTSPEILEKLGFTLNDVEDIDDKDLVGYAMTSSVYKVDEA